MQAPDDHRETRQGANHARCDEAMQWNHSASVRRVCPLACGCSGKWLLYWLD